MKKILKPKIVLPKKVVLKSFTITAIIPTMPYGNIQPAITVEADSIEAATEVVLPFINKMMALYDPNAPKHEEEKKPSEPSRPEKTTVEEPEGKGEDKPATDASVPYQKALAAIKTAYSLPALDMISDQVIFSKKLNDGEKIRLKPVVEARRNELQAQL